MQQIIVALGGGAGIAAILTAVLTVVKRTSELQPNHGGSIKDKVNKTADTVTQNSLQVKELVSLFTQLNERIGEDAHSTHEYRKMLTSQLDHVLNLVQENRGDIKELRGNDINIFRRLEELEKQLNQKKES